METFINEKSVTVVPEGRLDSAASDEFQKVLEETFTQEADSLTLDFSKVDYISSKGLRVLVSVYKSLNGRSMEIVNANPSVVEVIRISGLLPYFHLK